MTTFPQYSSSAKKACLPVLLKPFAFTLTTDQRSRQITNDYTQEKREYYFNRENSFYAFYYDPPFTYPNILLTTYGTKFYAG